MSRPPKTTWARLKNHLQIGHGSGHGQGYKSLWELKRWNASPMSVQILKPVPPFARSCHFFSRSEWLLALVFSWLGAHVREQYPLWPWSHPHPLYGLNADRDTALPWSPGMIEICTKVGIEHGVFVGTRIPYIWTIDLALTIPWVDKESPGCCLVSVKPLESERYLYIDPLDRGPEKLEGERQYAQSLDIPYFVGDRSLFPGDLLGQLEWLADAAVIPVGHPWQDRVQNFLDRCGADLGNYPLMESSIRLQKDFGATKREADYLVQHCLWHQLIDCDLSKYIDMAACPKPGGRRLKAAMREFLVGGKA